MIYDRNYAGHCFGNFKGYSNSGNALRWHTGSGFRLRGATASQSIVDIKQVMAATGGRSFLRWEASPDIESGGADAERRENSWCLAQYQRFFLSKRQWAGASDQLKSDC